MVHALLAKSSKTRHAPPIAPCYARRRRDKSFSTPEHREVRHRIDDSASRMRHPPSTFVVRNSAGPDGPKTGGINDGEGVPRRRLTKYPLWKRPRGQLEKALTHRDLHRHTSFDQPAVRPFNRSGSAQLAENPARMPQSPSKSEATLEGQKVGHSQTSQATNLITDENVERPESTTEKCKSARLRAAAVAFQGGSD